MGKRNLKSTTEEHRAIETTRAASDSIQLALHDVGEAGSFEGMASVQGSIANGPKGPVTFKKGAFTETLRDRGGVYPLLWQHEDSKPIGKVTLVETSEGLKAYGQITQNTQGKEITELLRDNVPLGLSIGFNPEQHSYEKHSSGTLIRHVSKARLKEMSIVTFPADPNATIRVVHNESGEEQEITTNQERVRHSAIGPIVSMNVEDETEKTFVGDIVDAIIDDGSLEIHKGRVFSEKNLTRMRVTAETLLDLIAMADPGFSPSLLPKYKTEDSVAFVADAPGEDQLADAAIKPEDIVEAPSQISIDAADVNRRVQELIGGLDAYELKAKVDEFLETNGKGPVHLSLRSKHLSAEQVETLNEIDLIEAEMMASQT